MFTAFGFTIPSTMKMSIPNIGINVFWQKEKFKMGKYTTKLILLWYDCFGENQTPLKRNGMAAIPKIDINVICYCICVKLIKYGALTYLWDPTNRWTRKVDSNFIKNKPWRTLLLNGHINPKNSNIYKYLDRLVLRVNPPIFKWISRNQVWSARWHIFVLIYLDR